MASTPEWTRTWPAAQINSLPEDELVYPPNKPNRKIYAGYWAASRIGSSGMDGGWVVRVAVAYDLTCTAKENAAPVYSDEEKRLIEHDLLLESTYLAACDPAINNKSVGNLAGAAVVGMCVGHPGSGSIRLGRVPANRRGLVPA